MLHTARVAEALEENRVRFTDHDRRQGAELSASAEALRALEERSEQDLCDALHRPRNGALPSREWEEGGRRVVLPFPRQFAHHEEARAWAAETLYDRLTFAADGSQIQPVPDVSVPVAAVQVGWFENPHNPAVPYVKDVRVELLPPDEVFVSRNGVSVFSDQRVSLRRFEREVDVLCAWMRDHAGLRPLPLAFWDGSLVVTFAQQLEPSVREIYVENVVRMLRTSEETRVPLVGYVDESRARDLVSMLRALAPELQAGDGVTDATLLAGSMAWGDRTPAWRCDREGILDEYETADGERWGDRVCFAYLRTTATHPPARLDLPAWVVDEGHTEDVAQLVRAEVAVGNGYPYAIETADAVAVITAEDRRRFYGMFERFAEENGIRLRVASKLQSKLRRR